MEDNIIGQILLQLFLIALNAIFACTEIAVISMNDNKLAKMAAQGDKRAIRLARLTSQSARFLATIQVAITLSGFLGSAFAAGNFSPLIVNWLVNLGVTISPSTLNTIAVFLITLILSYLTLVFGELVPKRVAMKKAESLALGFSGLIAFISRIFAPLVWILTASTNVILRLLQIDPDSEDNAISEEEIRMMVDVGTEKGVIDIEEKEFIQNIFEFDDTTISEFATHRTDVVILWLDETLEEWEERIYETRHSHYPVCNETTDNVIGILNIKDYIGLKEKTMEKVTESILKPPYFIPESVSADHLFKHMKKSRNHFAVVLDEYGGMSGIVTIFDLLEQLVGDLDDVMESDAEFAGIRKIDDSTWEIVGNVYLDDVAEQIKVHLPVDDYDIFSGFVFGSYGAIPDDGTSFEFLWEDLLIHVLEIKDHRVRRALVTHKTEEISSTDEHAVELA